MSDRYFPIVSATACRLKWAWSTIYLTNGTTGSCHRSDFGKLNKSNFDNFHNLPGKQLSRQQMLSGNWPEGGCEYCKNIEDAGGYSDRNFQNTVPNVYPKELDQDPTLTNIDPVILEIFFNNTCNLSCIYCTEKFSSSIQKENIKYHSSIIPEEHNKLEKNYYNELSPLLWNWLDKNFYKLQRLHVLGGEPLIQVDFDRLIDFIDDHPNPCLELNIVTNLIVKKQHLVNQIEKLKTLIVNQKIKRVDILCSVDSWGDQQEYVRHGFNCEQFADNFEYLLKFDFIRLGIISTINSLSIPTMPALAKKYQHWYRQREIFWYAHLVLPLDTHVLSPRAFDYQLWEPFFKNTIECIDADTFDAKQTRLVIQGISSQIKHAKSNFEMQKKLVKYLNEIDFRRNLNWKTTFPWLKKELENVV